MTTDTAVKTPDAAAQPRHVAPAKATAKNGATKKNAAPTVKKTAKRKKSSKPSHPVKSKSEIILALVGRAKGATLGEIMKATDWQAHSVRGFISLAISRRGLKIESTKNAKSERVYRVVTRKGK